MDAILFELAAGGGIAIDAEEISALWSGKNDPGTTAIERMGRDEVIVVVGEYDKITAALFDNMDLRPKKKVKKTTDKKKATVIGLGNPSYSTLNKFGP